MDANFDPSKGHIYSIIHKPTRISRNNHSLYSFNLTNQISSAECLYAPLGKRWMNGRLHKSYISMFSSIYIRNTLNYTLLVTPLQLVSRVYFYLVLTIEWAGFHKQ